jgi:CRISPR-associated endonuclease Csn1
MKKILGLDLGTNSIGWALIDADEKNILGMGSRIIPMWVRVEQF